MVAKKLISAVDIQGKSRIPGRGHGRHRKNRKLLPQTKGETGKTSTASVENSEHRGEARMSGQQLYEEAKRLAREADRNGGPQPVALLQKAASTGYPPAIYALANW